MPPFFVYSHSKIFRDMSLQCGIVGLPNVGKSTLFNCLSSGKAQAANFPFCTIEPNVGVITVPDERLNKLAELVKPQKVIPTTVEIVDIAGLIKGSSKGEGLGNQFLGNIRETDAIIHVLRCFDDDNVVHVDGSIDPLRDKEVIDYELELKDLETVLKRIERATKTVKSGEKAAKKELEILKLLKGHLEQGLPARTAPVEKEDLPIVHNMFLLTSKPILYVCNVDEASVKSGNSYTEKVAKAISNENAELLFISAGIEAEITQLESYEERLEFLQDMGLSEPGMNKVIQSAYRLLNLSTYLTAGEKEVRAWTITTGMTAPQAAGVIHSDFEKGFIRAEVIRYEDYISLGSEQACKEAGKMAVEGKEYIVKDGDVIYFRFNV